MTITILFSSWSQFGLKNYIPPGVVIENKNFYLKSLSFVGVLHYDSLIALIALGMLILIIMMAYDKDKRASKNREKVYKWYLNVN
ncbi:MAG: hypothetical protein ACFFEY_18280 [Candidatus Thorarchaeota archaeon]